VNDEISLTFEFLPHYAPPLTNIFHFSIANKQEENWGMGNVYTNNWKAPTSMVSIESSKLRGGGQLFKRQIWDAARPTIEAWTGMKLQSTSVYGIRVYTEGAILSPHVDRLPLVSSCIINVDQDVDEPWILEVYDRHDRAVNVTMEPGTFWTSLEVSFYNHVLF
jgi:prolyl 4-hydroxylase